VKIFFCTEVSRTRFKMPTLLSQCTIKYESRIPEFFSFITGVTPCLEIYSCTVSHEIIRSLCNPKVHCHIHESLSLDLS
jgi:hypothetical protein